MDMDVLQLNPASLTHVVYEYAERNRRTGGIQFGFDSRGFGSFEEISFYINTKTGLRRLYVPDYFIHLADYDEQNRSGRYVWETSNAQAEITISETSQTDAYQISGFALWGTDRAFGPNQGEIDFIAELIDDTFTYEKDTGTYDQYSIVIRFIDDVTLTVKEESARPVHGMNVTFNGEYSKAPPH